MKRLLLICMLSVVLIGCSHTQSARNPEFTGQHIQLVNSPYTNYCYWIKDEFVAGTDVVNRKMERTKCRVNDKTTHAGYSNSQSDWIPEKDQMKCYELYVTSTIKPALFMKARYEVPCELLAPPRNEVQEVKREEETGADGPCGCPLFNHE